MVMTGRLPTFTVLGPGRSGTTFLHTALGQHPDVFVTPVKEPPFFDLEYEKGLAFYLRTYFSGWKGETAAGESRVAKFALPFVVQRVRETLPDAKLIAMIRNPVDRAYSGWWLRTCHGFEHLSFREAAERGLEESSGVDPLDGPEGPACWRGASHSPSGSTQLRRYVQVGHYAEHLARYYAVFPRVQIRVVLFDDLRLRTSETIRALWGFLGVDPSVPVGGDGEENEAPSRVSGLLTRWGRRLGLPRVVPRAFTQAVRRRLRRLGARPPMSREDRAWLTRYYHSHNQRLESLLGITLADWREPRDRSVADDVPSRSSES